MQKFIEVFSFSHMLKFYRALKTSIVWFTLLIKFVIADNMELTRCRPGLRFTEKMSGSLTVKGTSKEVDCQFVVTITADDIEKFLNDDQHEASVVGTVECPLLSNDAVTISMGKIFMLLQPFTNRTAHTVNGNIISGGGTINFFLMALDMPLLLVAFSFQNFVLLGVSQTLNLVVSISVLCNSKFKMQVDDPTYTNE